MIILEKLVLSPTRLWASVDVKNNRIVAGEDKGDVYIWDLVNPGNNIIAYPTGVPSGEILTYWYTVAIENNVVLAGAAQGRVYISLNLGVSWEERSPSANRSNMASAIETKDGICSIFLGDNVGIYKTTNYGESWSQLDPLQDGENSFGHWYSIDIDNGNVIAAMYSDKPYLKGRLCISTDSGLTWVERKPAGEGKKAWRAVAIHGNYMLAGIYNGRLYLSNNFGNSWTETRPAGNNDIEWRCASISDSLMVVGSDNGRLYVSEDYGESWAEIRPYGDVDKRWLHSSADDKMIVVAPFGGEIWIITPSIPIVNTLSAERSRVHARVILRGGIS